MNNTKTITFGHNDIEAVAKQFWSFAQQCSIYSFQGPLGAGKTTLVRAILKEAGITGIVSSPTFTYVSVYKNSNGQQFNHFDLYRMSSLDDFLEHGFDEYLYAEKSWCFIEWPAIIMQLLHHRTCHISLDYHGDDQRLLTYELVT